MPAVGPGSSSEELEMLLDESGVSAVVPASDCCAGSGVLGASPAVSLVTDGSGDVSRLPGAGALVQEVSETRADMPSAAARRVLVVSDHSRFFISLLFSIFIGYSQYHIIYTIFEL